MNSTKPEVTGGFVPRALLGVCALALALAGCPAAAPETAPPTTGDVADPGLGVPVDPTEGRTLPAIGPEDTDTAVGIHGAVTSAEANASKVGLAVLQEGGNAVDAAVAVGFALGVTHPSAGNIGGGGFMVIRMADGRTTAIDYRETAPGKAHRDMYLDEKGEVTDNSRKGALAAGIPGDVAGFALAHEKYGSRPWKGLVEPAVALARDGWVLDRFHADDLAYAAQRMEEYGFADSLPYVRKPDASPYSEGDTWAQPELAETLEAIADRGAAGFYEGPVAASLVAGVQARGGIWTLEDLEHYRAIEREPLEFDYRGYQIIAMPPPSAGGVVLRQVLAASEALELYALPYHGPEEAHLYAEALRRTYADRNMLIGDPDFVNVPISTLLDVSYVADRMADIDPGRATPSSEIGAGAEIEESHQTTHFSVVDQWGNAVSNTFTLNGGFGSKVIIPGTGVILNNEMDDFTAKVGAPNMFGLVQGPQNGIEPGKRMLSSMTPTIVVREGKLRAVVGSPGGPTITTTVAQIIVQIIDHGRTISQAVRAPRIHHQWLPDRILLEDAVPAEVQESLKAKGHELRSWDGIGHANCIEVDPATGGYRAVADQARDGGLAVAY